VRHHLLIASAGLVTILACIACLSQEVAPKKDQALYSISFNNVHYLPNNDWYGFEINFWHNSKGLFGIVAYRNGGDDAIQLGIIEDLKYDEKTNDLRFSVKLRHRWVLYRAESSEPPKMTLLFTGHMSSALMNGTFTLRNDSAVPAVAVSTEVFSYPGYVASQNNFDDYESWLAAQQRVLSQWGPAW
jgi:hypothetical protein